MFKNALKHLNTGDLTITTTTKNEHLKGNLWFFSLVDVQSISLFFFSLFLRNIIYLCTISTVGNDNGTGNINTTFQKVLRGWFPLFNSVGQRELWKGNYYPKQKFSQIESIKCRFVAPQEIRPSIMFWVLRALALNWWIRICMCVCMFDEEKHGFLKNVILPLGSKKCYFILHLPKMHLMF